MSDPNPVECDYLIVGGGATGLAFADSLLNGVKSSQAENGSDSESAAYPRIVIVDRHMNPGGQWQDSYEFVRLHQPSAMYGVETEPLEPQSSNGDGIAEDKVAANSLGGAHRATRKEILQYYSKVVNKMNNEHGLVFLGGYEFDFETFQSSPSSSEKNFREYTLKPSTTSSSSDPKKVRVFRRLVDARWLEPDLPVFVGPKFKYDPSKIDVVPVNALSQLPSNEKIDSNKKFVIIGAGKTGMDAVTYLQSNRGISPKNICWVSPNEAWITARENIGSCMEFLHTCVTLAKQQGETSIINSAAFQQNGFQQWEKDGHIYRIDPDSLPTKFKDATLCQRELKLLQQIPKNNMIRGQRVARIDNDGNLEMADGSIRKLPWATADGTTPISDVTFVHCSAGAFNYTKQPDQNFPAIFEDGRITIQDVYGTPGFCFVGSLIGKLESMNFVGDKSGGVGNSPKSDEERNKICRAPQPSQSTPDESSSKTVVDLGPSGGDIGSLNSSHGLVQRVQNLKDWYNIGLGEWLHGSGGHRLFNLGHMSLDESRKMVNETCDYLKEVGLVE